MTECNFCYTCDNFMRNVYFFVSFFKDGKKKKDVYQQYVKVYIFLCAMLFLFMSGGFFSCS